MSSYAGEHTAAARQSDRRQARARKDRGHGSGGRQGEGSTINDREARKLVPRHHLADFAQLTREAMDLWLLTEQQRAEVEGFAGLVGIPVSQCARFVEHGIIPGAFSDQECVAEIKAGTKPTPVRVIITSNTGLKDTGIEITRDGFQLIGGGQPGLPVASISVSISPLFCLRFKWDHIARRLLVT
jgi:hypothetical protein